MLTEEFLRELGQLISDVGESPPDGMSELRLLGLPEMHIALLERFNGFSVSGGTYRLLGHRRPGPSDLLTWNEPGGWKRSWKGLADPFLCFGMSAFGDQWAYRIAGDGALSPEIYQLDGSTLDGDMVAASFEEFADLELLEVAREPFDAVLVEALTQLGPIGPDNLWVFSPSPLLGGTETVDQILAMPAVAAMSVLGQIATSVREGTGTVDG